MKEAGVQALRFPIFLDGHQLSSLYPASTLPPDNFLVPNIPREHERPPSPIGRKDPPKPPASEIRSTRLKPTLRQGPVPAPETPRDPSRRRICGGCRPGSPRYRRSVP